VPDSGTDSIANGGSHCGADSIADRSTNCVANGGSHGGADGSTYRFAHTCADVRAGGVRHRGLVSFLELLITVR
jgi:hypothetical protein